MRSILFASAAIFVFLGAAGLLAVFLMPWLLAYGFSAPAALILLLGGVILVALAAQIDGLHKVESAIYGLQKSLRHAASASQASGTLRPSTAPIEEKPGEKASGPAPEEAKVAPAATTGKTGAEKSRPAAGGGAPPRPAEKREPPAPGASMEGGVAAVGQQKEVPPPRPKEREPVAAPPVRESAVDMAPPAPPAPKMQEEPSEPPAAEASASREPQDLAAGKSATGEKETGGEKPPAEEEKAFLYIVREETVRGRRARVLSDGTIEAELDDGWLRFENMDHLNEYLDALEELRKKGMI